MKTAVALVLMTLIAGACSGGNKPKGDASQDGGDDPGGDFFLDGSEQGDPYAGDPSVDDGQAPDDGGPLDDDAGPTCLPPYQTPVFAPAADDTIVYDALIEASGYAPTAEWVALTAGDLCGGPEPELVLVKNGHRFFSVLHGPTPYPGGSGDLDSAAAHPWRAATTADVDGDGKDEIVAVRHVTASGLNDLVVAKADADCFLTGAGGLTIGSPSNSDWVGVAAGDYDGDGAREIVALKQDHSAFILLGISGGALATERSMDLDTEASHPWRALAAGDLDGDGRDELVAAREAGDGADTVFAYRYDSGTAAFVRMAGCDEGSNGNSSWTGAAVGDFNGDGRSAIALIKNQHSNFILRAYDGSSILAGLGASDLVTVAGQSWKGIVAADFLGGDMGAEELIAVRSTGDSYRTNVFVFGNRFHRAQRESALSETHAQYAGAPRLAPDDHIDPEGLKQWLLDTHTNVYSLLIARTNRPDYLDLVAFLEATRDFCVDGRQLRVWVTLLPPTETDVSSQRCSLPADSPTTPFSEADYFPEGLDTDSCDDYVGWAGLLGKLATIYPHLVALNIDDFTHNLGFYTPIMLAQIESNLKKDAPWMSLSPTLYYNESGEFVLSQAPDLGLSLDTMLFYFRNEKQGVGPCAGADCPCVGTDPCRPPSESCPGACLSGQCAENTVAHAPGEIADMASGLAAGRKLQVGIYFSGHSRCGEPSAQYNLDLAQTALSDPHVDGITVYTTKHPTTDCSDILADKGCVVHEVFSP